MEKATIHSDQGMFVTVRGEEDTSSVPVERLQIDTVVSVTSHGEKWSKIKFKRKTGFVMNQFLVFGKDD